MLDVQADRTRRWSPEYGDYVEWLHGRGQLPDAQWRRYGQHQLAFYVRGRPLVNEGEPLPFDFVEVARRGDSRDDKYTGGQWTTHVTFSDGVTGPIEQGPLNLGLSSQADEFSTPTYVTFGSAKPGTNTLRVRITDYDLTWTKRPADLSMPTEYDLGRIAFAVVPPGVDVVPAVVDPSLSAGVAAAVSVDDLLCWSDGKLTGSISIARPPVDVAFHATLVAGGREWPVGDLVAAKGDAVGYGPINVWIDGFGPVPASGVSLKLTADHALAKRSASLTRYWQGEVVIRGVPIRSQ